MRSCFRRISIILVLVMLVMSLGGCTTYDNFVRAFIEVDEEPEDTVRIGVFEPLSGPDKEKGELEKMGVELAYDLYPTALGKQVELVYADNKSDIYTAEAAIQDLISKRPAVVIGSYGSVYSLVAAEYLEEAQIPAIAVTNINPLVTANNPFYFRVCFVESYQGVAVAKYAVEEMEITQAAILKPVADDGATAVCQTFSDKMIQLTEDENAILFTEEYKEDDSDFTQQLNKIKESGVRAVFVPAEVTDAVTIISQANKMGVNTLFLGTQDWESDQFLAAIGKNISDNIAISTIFDAKSGITEMTSVFLRAYKAKYGNDAEPDSAVALGFDAYIIALDSLNRIGTALDGDLLRRSIGMEKQFAGASGSISFDEKGDPIKSVVIKKIHNGEFINSYTVEPVWKPVAMPLADDQTT